MHSANALLAVLAFVLGLVLTFALMIGRAEGEVPKSQPPTDTASEDSGTDSP